MGSEPLARALFGAAAAVSVAITLTIFGFMLALGAPLIIDGAFLALFTEPWLPGQGKLGIAPMILGTLVIATLAMLFSLPISLGSAALISGLGGGPFPLFLHRMVRFMTGIPTVVYGFAGIFLLVPMVREWGGQGSGLSVLSAALLLSLLIAPTMILLFMDAFGRVPRSYLMAAKALGATPVQCFVHVMLPNAWRGLAGGVVLASGRAIGDTLIALMIAGNAVLAPDSVLDPARTLTAHIALVVAADFDSLEFRTLFACGIVLYLCTLVMILVARWIGAAPGPRA